jgi:CDP-diglyceride synthetase
VRQRVISAGALVPIVVIPYLLGDPWLTLGIAALALLASLEVARLLVRAGFPVGPLPMAFAPPVAVVGLSWRGAPAGLGLAFVGAVLVVAAIDAFRRPDVRDGFLVWVGTSFGAIYASLLAFAAGILVVAPPVPADARLASVLDEGRVWLLVLVLSVWTFDTFAYVAGRGLRRGHFLNHISPSKTWSGVIGGTIAAISVAALLSWAAGQGIIEGAVLGLLIAVAAQSGDVAESMLKRAAGVKDSGTLIPGHGGVLDRVDSILFAAPAVFGFLVVLGQLRTA